ncbi:helix-turn-helix domain-containing protein [Dongia sp.]|uniref:helix-turn-helix domain-containing protein n=1 Tax=Dongia sp. TaxID=1977262 RepID=UPI0035B3BE72
MESFAERLRMAVGQSGGATHVAQVSGIPLTTLNNYLAGRSEPKRPALAILARVLRRDLGWLVSGAGWGDADIRPDAGAADADLLDQVTEAMLQLYAELGRRPARSGLGRRCAQIHNAIAATARDMGERRRMLELALALQRQELASGTETSREKRTEE